MKQIDEAKDIIEKYRLQKGQQYDALGKSNRLLFPAITLFLNAEKVFKSKKPSLSNKTHINIAYSNLLVTYVTVLEVFYKHLIMTNEWDKDGYNKLLKKSITLGEAYEMFAHEQVTRQYLISNYFSFQNFESISSTFDQLIGKKFYNEIERQEVIYHRVDVKRTNKTGLKPIVDYNDKQIVRLIDAYPEWRKVLIELYLLRNKYVHDGEPAVYSAKKHHSIMSIIGAYKGAVFAYVTTTFRKELESANKTEHLA